LKLISGMPLASAKATCLRVWQCVHAISSSARRPPPLPQDRLAGQPWPGAAAGAVIVDPMPWFCALTSCPVVIGNVLVYYDASHVTPEYARFLAPLLQEHLG
jgi:hypothetical protein